MQLSKNWTGLSSQISHTNYIEEASNVTACMVVQFNTGTKYRYIGVPVDIWEKSLIAPSIGQFLNKEIKPFYQAVKII